MPTAGRKPLLALVDVPHYLVELDARSRKLARSLRAALEPLGTLHLLESGASALDEHRDALIYVTDGVLKLMEGGRFVRYYSEDDVLLVTSESAGNATLSSDFATRLLVCPREVFEESALADLDVARTWVVHQQLQLRILGGLAAAYARDHVVPTAEIQHFPADSAIIEEGDAASHIYVLISGEARVLVSGTEVGHVHEMEVFGEMGFFTNQRRTASVEAVRDCEVQQIPLDDFERLIRSRPRLALGMLQTMAERVVALNDRIARP